MNNGIYKVTFIGQGTGNGVIIVNNGKYAGGDGYFYYSGTFHEHLTDLTATITVSRHTPGQASVFGRDSFTETFHGVAGSTDFQLEGPGKVFTITGQWLDIHEVLKETPPR